MRGIFATKDIPKGETLLFVPDHLIMSLDKSKKSAIGSLMVEEGLVSKEYELNAPNMAV